MSLFVPRQSYKPFEYPKYFEYYNVAKNTIWRPETVDMAGDIFDFNNLSTKDECDIISEILKTFTQREIRIGDYWSDEICKNFPLHEITAAARAHAFAEVIHAQAYDWLNATLGIDNYHDFLGDEVALKMLEFYVKSDDALLNLATFSGVGEGVALFSSFAVLLSLCLDGRFKGIQQIISWSIRDENQHSNMGCELFVDACLEANHHEYVKPKVLEAFELGLLNEFACIDQIFDGRQLKNIDANSLKDYIKYRRNNRVKALGYEDCDLLLTGEYKKIREWFEPMAFSQSDQDFFANQLDGGNYTSLLSQDYSAYDFTQTKVKNWKTTECKI